MPSGDAEEIAVRAEVFRFFARLTARTLLERPTLILLLVRNPLRPMARSFNKVGPNVGSCLGPLAHLTLVAGAHLRCHRSLDRRRQRQVLRAPMTGLERIRALCRARSSSAIASPLRAETGMTIL